MSKLTLEIASHLNESRGVGEAEDIENLLVVCVVLHIEPIPSGCREIVRFQASVLFSIQRVARGW